MIKKEQGFTLIEMLIVLAVIAILLILLVPNLSERNQDIHTKGEDALVQMAEAQVQAYYIDHGKYPDSVKQLVDQNYLTTNLLANGTKEIVFENSNSYKVIVRNVP
ncbi:competence type IV pilus major pilin ComGC [Amphibacillus cookii]|uniref:competence type IV pilus major pilin ComGC n=1 Tax=Amphibacillus cookii TaxID=767787 RepID=UPI00195E5D77|nr:competence type IV pilus major pilin ComGC [Amphibacillus cookii]MBM7542413.1 competence protein ComGC [Amphibacillus cookii]